MSFNEFAVVTVGRNGYRIIFWFMSKFCKISKNTFS